MIGHKFAAVVPPYHSLASQLVKCDLVWTTPNSITGAYSQLIRGEKKQRHAFATVNSNIEGNTQGYMLAFSRGLEEATGLKRAQPRLAANQLTWDQ